jgi:hypothetical protein
VKRIRGDEPIGVVIHICTETTQGNSMYLSLSQTSKNIMFFFLSFILFLLQNWRTRGQNRFCGGIETGGKEEVVGKKG